MTINTFSEAMQKDYLHKYEQQYPDDLKATVSSDAVERYTVPRTYNDTTEHFRNFFDSVRTRKTPAEDAVFGFRAAGAALLSNVSMERRNVVQWNPETMKIG